MTKTINWNRKAVKLLSKFISEERMDNFNWYNDTETEKDYILTWEVDGSKQQFIVDKKTQKVTFVN
jgi:hypothetical protein